MKCCLSQKFCQPVKEIHSLHEQLGKENNLVHFVCRQCRDVRKVFDGDRHQATSPQVRKPHPLNALVFR